MEPVFRPLCARFHTLPTLITRSLRNFKASARFIRLEPQIAGFGPQRMCPSCGLVTSRSKEFCLRVWETFSGRVPMVKRCDGTNCNRRSKLSQDTDAVRDLWLYRENRFCPSVGERWRSTSGVIARNQSGLSWS